MICLNFSTKNIELYVIIWLLIKVTFKGKPMSYLTENQAVWTFVIIASLPLYDC